MKAQSLFVALLVPVAMQAGIAQAQTIEGSDPARAASAITLRSATRLVVEDVLVTDTSGKPIVGLPRSAFHISDDGKLQQIQNFDEASEPHTVDKIVSANGSYSNSTVLSGEGAFNVFLIDTAGIEIQDQMYLRLQALQYLGSMPRGTSAMVFRANGHGTSVLVQALTSDPLLLEQAIKNSVPALTAVNEDFYGPAEMSNVVNYLAQFQARKSLLWFAGRFPLTLNPNGVSGSGRNGAYSEDLEAVRATYRSLEKARVAIYPVDVRGIVNVGLSLNRPVNQREAEEGVSPVVAGEDTKQRASWSSMDEVAAATGGHAYYSNNAIAQVIGTAVDLGRHAYTLTYHPDSYSLNGEWHKIKLVVDGPYTVSYRQGYFADNTASPEHRRDTTQAVQATQGAASRTSAPLSLQESILFHAKVKFQVSSSSLMLIQYAIAASDLDFQKDASGKNEARFKVAALAYNITGDVLSHAVDGVATHYSAEQMQEADRVGVPMLQQIHVTENAKFLLLSVVDLHTGRTGTIQLTVDDAKGGR